MKNVFARTDVGRVMQYNQDAYLVLDGEYPLYAVADGMGGTKGGHVASAVAQQGLKELLQGQTPSVAALRLAIAKINRRIYDMQLNNDRLTGMGTTLTVLWDAGERFLLGHVGDSRCYLMRDGSLYQISSDHSLVQALLSRGKISSEEAQDAPYRNVITKAVGTGFGLLPDLSIHQKNPGDRWLLCSDGLTEGLRANDIVQTLAEKDVQKAADTLLAKALEKGGRDNITLILIEVDA